MDKVRPTLILFEHLIGYVPKNFKFHKRTRDSIDNIDLSKCIDRPAPCILDVCGEVGEVKFWIKQYNSKI